MPKIQVNTGPDMARRPRYAYAIAPRFMPQKAGFISAYNSKFGDAPGP